MTMFERGCEGCGQCCKQGGPALHSADLPLVRSGKVPISALITIRKGELAYNPIAESVQPLTVELVKIAGAGRQWQCRYYESRRGCTIYEHRPQACRALRCWDTAEILALVEKDTLSRFDILSGNHFLLPVIREHEGLFPCQDLQLLHTTGPGLFDQTKSEWENRVREEVRFRSRVVGEFQLQLCDELFYFGRPLFQLLQALGVRVSETSEGIQLHWG